MLRPTSDPPPMIERLLDDQEHLIAVAPRVVIGLAVLLALLLTGGLVWFQLTNN